MTVRDAVWMQNLQFDAEEARLGLAGLLFNDTGLVGKARSGKLGGLKVHQTTTPSMQTQVDAGNCVVQGTVSAVQGPYICTADATVTLTHGNSTSQGRWDLVVYEVRDTVYGGAADDSRIRIEPGTPSATPAVPALPANCVELARVFIGASVSSIVDANITQGPYTAARGGVVRVADQATRDAMTPHDSMGVYRLDYGIIERYKSGLWIPEAYATDGGTISIAGSSIAAGASVHASVGFHGTRFTLAPRVTVSMNSAPNGTSNLVPRAVGVTTTGFDLYLYNAGSSTASWSAMQCVWFARQSSLVSADG